MLLIEIIKVVGTVAGLLKVVLDIIKPYLEKKQKRKPKNKRL